MSKKHYIMTAITLGAIAAVSAGLIGLANLATRNKIAKNEYDKTMSGIASIFGSEAIIEKEYAIEGYTYANYVYEISNDNYAFRTTGSNSYGKISLLIGIKPEVEETENKQIL